MLKAIAFAVMLAIGGCEVARTIAPNTTAGFEENGIIGALEGASGALLVTCRTLDGEVVRVAVDGLALTTGTTDAITAIRAARQKACTAAGAIHVISDSLDGERPVATVHRPAEDATDE
jgi:hypothetical protein